MAQDLGLHRAEAVKTDIDMRRRVWGACVISDRWYALILGHPFMIDVLDCDARVPVPTESKSPSSEGEEGVKDGKEVEKENEKEKEEEEEEMRRPLMFLGELTKLSLILGRVMKTIYGCVSRISIVRSR